MLSVRNYIYKQFFFLRKDKNLDIFDVGDLIKISILENEKKNKKIKNFIGVCIFKKKYNLGLKVIIQKGIKNNYLEKSFFLYSPSIVKIEILKKSIQK